MFTEPDALRQRDFAHIIFTRALVIGIIALLLILSKVFMHLSFHPPIYHINLFDAGHKLIPPLNKMFSVKVASWIWWFGTITIEFFFAVVLFSIVFFGRSIRIGLALATAVLLHAMFWHATVLPIPSNILWKFPLVTGEVPKPDDFWFSGHVTYAILFAIAVSHQKLWIKIFAWIYVVLIVLLVLSARTHYTIDVIGSFFVAYTLYDILTHFLTKPKISAFLYPDI